MAQFYDQNNPYRSYSSNTSISKDEWVYQNDNYKNMDSNARRANNLVKNSIKTDAQKERARVVKRQQRKKQRQRAFTTLIVACVILGGVAANTVSNIADNIQENSIVYDQNHQFAQEVIFPNTHRTYDNQHYFYDYDDIAAAIKEDGKDFSTELYKAYAYLGEYQTNKVMDYTNYNSVEDYVKANGFEDIESWEKSEKRKIILENEVSEKQSELAAMHSELNGEKTAEVVSSEYTGGK